MPRIKKKRGRYEEVRAERRKKKADLAGSNAKRRRLDDGTAASADDEQPETDDQLYFEDTTPGLGVIDNPQRPPGDEMVFHGLLDEDEQAYYASVNAKITANDFEDADEKSAFLDAVYRESRGKEMKLASSQSCSRHLERILRVSGPDQLRDFFQAILEGLTQLVQHRFGSHVCETLFLESAKHVTSDWKPDVNDTSAEKSSIASLFLQAADQLQQNIGFMLTEQFASHTVRALLLVLSGEPLEDPSAKNLLASKRKENLGSWAGEQTTSDAPRKVPKSFLKAMSKLTAAAVASLDTTYLRALATHSTGNPVLQLLLRLELVHSDKGRNLDDKSLFHRLVAPDSLESPNSEGAKFVLGLTFDPTGSRLVEVLVVHSPGKVFKKLYKGIWKERMADMAKNDTASFVAIKIIERLGKDELLEVQKAILPDLAILLRRRRFSLIKGLIDRSAIRELDFKPLVAAFRSVNSEDGPSLLQRLVYPATVSLDKEESSEEKSDLHGSLLAQSMLEVETLGGLVRENLSSMQPEELVPIASDTIASRVLQLSLTSSTTPMAYRRQMVPKFYGQLTTLATSSVASYLVDALWVATDGLHFMKERLAGELAAHEPELRDSYPGRKVWKNWSMDLYSRRRGEWEARAKGIADTKEGAEVKKTPIELARQRRAEEKAKMQQQESKPLVHANA
ncbi:uncharacterized protein HMPREF1541_02116 [Cyphellophora europaea CBS 101466]|uniref:Nucleolar protein 9 n=1 Tax=Cyphellophora europaea (strain CBS 101466) TaxID=1220924 RepID=W2S4I8_CYPE1|nr:uncharacterized protein HMPREF1541_02116 [Cyphellophora europaea CBS 101466]ETN42958.1 hypothetical protein HMPREF1541_02116 [Cyphellophora europaea CBS 101466]